MKAKRTLDPSREAVSHTLGESTVRAVIEVLQTLPGEALVGVFNDEYGTGPITEISTDSDGIVVFHE